MSDGIIEWQTTDGSAVTVRADAVASVRGVEGERVRVYLMGVRDPVYLADGVPWATAVQQWRAALGVGPDAALRTQVDALDAAGDSAEETVLALRSELATARRAVDQLTERLQEVEAERPYYESAGDRIAFLESELETRREACARAVDRAARAEREVERLESELEIRREMYASAVDRAARAEREVERLRRVER